MLSQLQVFKSIDNALALYYHQLGYPNYYNANGNGIFLQCIIDEELIDPDLPIENELGIGCDPRDCAYSWMNNETVFPEPHYAVISNQQKEEFIFYILQYCYKNSTPPDDKYIKEVLIDKIGSSISNTINPINKGSALSSLRRTHLNIFTAKELTKELRDRIDGEFENEIVLYYYTDISKPLQINDGQHTQFAVLMDYEERRLRVINYGLDIKGREDILYGIIAVCDSLYNIQHDQCKLDDEDNDERRTKSMYLDRDDIYNKHQLIGLNDDKNIEELNNCKPRTIEIKFGDNEIVDIDKINILKQQIKSEQEKIIRLNELLFKVTNGGKHNVLIAKMPNAALIQMEHELIGYKTLYKQEQLKNDYLQQSLHQNKQIYLSEINALQHAVGWQYTVNATNYVCSTHILSDKPIKELLVNIDNNEYEQDIYHVFGHIIGCMIVMWLFWEDEIKLFYQEEIYELEYGESLSVPEEWDDDRS